MICAPFRGHSAMQVHCYTRRALPRRAPVRNTLLVCCLVKMNSRSCCRAAAGVELFAMDLGPTSGRRKRPPVASPDYQPHWLDAPR